MTLPEHRSFCRFRRAGPSTSALLLAAALLAGCATPLPPVTWVRLPAEAPGAVPPAPRAAAPGEVWQLVLPVALPGHLDRDALLVPRGAAGLQPLAGVRWAEPLRDAAPRLLRNDLAVHLGKPLWTAPLPPGVAPTRQLRVELSAFDVAADGRGAVLQARWSLADPRGASPPRVFEAAFVTPAAGTDAEALAAAHRLALWQLAGRIAASALAP
jgi:uncharacterized lipoprotein YmbA